MSAIIKVVLIVGYLNAWAMGIGVLAGFTISSLHFLTTHYGVWGLLVWLLIPTTYVSILMLYGAKWIDALVRFNAKFFAYLGVDI